MHSTVGGSADRDHWNRRYFEALNLETTGVAPEPDKVVLDLINQYFDQLPGPVLVDAGTGLGRYLPSLLKKVNSDEGFVYGLDGSEQALAHAGNTHENDPAIRLEICDLNKPLKALFKFRVGAVLCTDVLSVVDSPLDLLRHIYAVLMDGGVLIATVQTTEDETLKDGEELPNEIPGTVLKPTEDGTTFRFFEASAFEGMCRKQGFTILTVVRFERFESAHVGRPYDHTHVEIAIVLQK